MKKIFITGGGGYVGHVLVPRLLKNYKVTVFDTFYFENKLPINSNLNIIQGDIRDVIKLEHSSKNHDIFINLACISNDSSFELNESLSTSINLDAFEPMVQIAKKNNIKRFIYASSSSVYGVSDKPNVTEDHPLVPLTLYNKYKGMCEPILFKYTDDDFCGVVFRPATVCGYSPRMRLDLSVNILTNHAFHNKVIKVFGGNQLRPNIHILDYCRFVETLILANSNKINNEIFNVGSENMSIMQIAKVVQKEVQDYLDTKEKIAIEMVESSDNRSYHINSDKAYKVLGFRTELTIKNAVKDICDAFTNNLINDPMNNIEHFNVKKIKSLDIS